MIGDRIRELLHRDPFEAFRILLSSGDTFIVRNPDLVALMKGEVFVASDREDTYRIIPYLHIAAVERVPSSSRSGRKRRGSK